MSEENLTLEDLLCMLDEVEPGQGRRGYEILINQLRQGPNAGLYLRIEQMAEDAGTDRRKIGWEREAVIHNQQVDHLLTLDTDALALELAKAEDMEMADYQALTRICAVRRARGDGDAGKLAALELELASFGPPGGLLVVRQALEKLDLTLRELVIACAYEVRPSLARTRAAQYVLARVMRELHANDQRPELLTTG